MSLDRFLPPNNNQHTAVERRCANPRYRKVIKGINYTLKVKGKEDIYCQSCAKQILRPFEASEENL